MRSGAVVAVVLIEVRGERGRWFEAGLGEEALRKGRQIAVGQVKFDALNTVHGEENDRGSERFPVPDHYGEIFKGREFGSAQAEARGGESKNHPPELFARITQGCNDQCSGLKRFARLGGRGWTVAG